MTIKSRKLRELIKEMVLLENEGVGSLKIQVTPNENHENSGWEYDQYKLVCDVQCFIDGEGPNDMTHTFFGVDTSYQILLRDLLDSILPDTGTGLTTQDFENLTRSDSDNYSIDGLEAVVEIMESAQQEQQNSSSW